MKVHFLNCIILLLVCISKVNAQFKIGDNPTVLSSSAVLELESTNKAFILPRVSSTDAVSNPVDGLMVYDLSSHCVKSYRNGSWSYCHGGITTQVVVVDCDESFLNGWYLSGVAMDGANYLYVKLRNNTFFPVTYSLAASDVQLSGASDGIYVSSIHLGSVDGSVVSSLTIPATETRSLYYKLLGTPSALGQLTALWQKEALGCSHMVTVYEPGTIDPVDAQLLILTQIGQESDAGGPSTTTYNEFELLQLTGLISSNLLYYQAYIANNPASFSSPATLSEVQTMVDLVNAQMLILVTIGQQADTGGPSTTTFSDFTTLHLNSVVASNVGAYQAYIATHPDLFSAPATLAEVQSMIDLVNQQQYILAVVGQQADAGGPSTLTLSELQLLALNDVVPENLIHYQHYIATHPNSFSSSATFAEVQAMLTIVNNQQSILAQIGQEADAGGPSTTTISNFNALEMTGVVTAHLSFYQHYIATHPDAFSAPATLDEVQAMINLVNSQLMILATIGQQADTGGPSTTSLANFLTLELTGVVAGHLNFYQNYISTHPNAFSSPATFAEVQAMINLVNTQQTILATIGYQADTGGPSTTTLTHLYILELTGIVPANLSYYQNYIITHPNSFSSPATISQVQTMLTIVNAQVVILTQIGLQADAGGPSTTTTSDLQFLDIQGVLWYNQSLYQSYIATHPNSFSYPATLAEVQAMVNYVNAQVIEPSFYFNENLIPEPNRWMTALPGYLKLSQLDIPGTHDSGALYDPALLADSAKCQDYSILEQLNMGVRYLDIRCRSYYNSFTIHHGSVYQNLTFNNVLQSCITFLTTNPNEVILMSVQEEYTSLGSTLTFDQIFSNFVLTYPNLFYRSNTIPTLEASRGKIVLLRDFNWNSWNTPGVLPFGIDTNPSINNTTYNFFYTGNGDDSIVTQNKYETHSTTDSKWNYFIDFYRAIFLNTGDNTLILNFGSGVYTPWWSFGVPRIRSMAEYTNSRIEGYYNHRMARFHKNGTIAVDFVTYGLSRAIYKNNFWANADNSTSKSIILYTNNPPESNGVKVIGHPGVLEGGFYTFGISELEWFGYKNDTLSFINVSYGVIETILYENGFLGGSYLYVNPGNSGMPSNFNDRMSSLKFR